MLGLLAFNARGIASAIARRLIVSAVIVLCGLLYSDFKDIELFAQAVEKADAPAEGALPDAEIILREVLNQPQPKIIRKTVEPVNKSWFKTKSFGEKMDWMHANLYQTIQDQIQRFDYCFKPPQGKERIVELSRFRVGLFGEGKINKHDNVNLDPVVDFDADIELPNMKRRLKLIFTTVDPTELPGRDITEQQDTALRAAVSRQWWPNVHTQTGVRIRRQPELFANVVWANSWKNKIWTIYPEQKFYWENEGGFGEISTVAFDYWQNRWNTRFSTSIKWSELDRDADARSDRKDEGFRTSEVFIFGYATELLDETQLNRMISGGDVGRGWGLRLAAFTGFHFVDEYRAGVFYRVPLRKKWMYFMVEPDVKWKNSNQWDREWTIKCGIEILFWGGKER